MEIHWVGLTEIDGDERERVEARIRQLGEVHNDLIDVRIAGHETNHHRHGGREIRISCQARGREIVATSSAADLGPALSEAIDVFEHEVHRMRQKRRDATRVSVS